MKNRLLVSSQGPQQSLRPQAQTLWHVFNKKLVLACICRNQPLFRHLDNLQDLLKSFIITTPATQIMGPPILSEPPYRTGWANFAIRNRIKTIQRYAPAAVFPVSHPHYELCWSASYCL